MAFADPKNPDRPLTEAEIPAMLERRRAEAEAGLGTDLDLLLAEWEAENAADRRAMRPDKPSAA